MPKETNKKQENKKQSKDKKHFVKDFKAELKRVIWPTPKQLLNNTVAVITVVLITAAIVFVLDFAFESMNTYGIDKLKEVVENMESENADSSNSTTENETVENATTDENSEVSDENTDTSNEAVEEGTNEVDENSVTDEANNEE